MHFVNKKTQHIIFYSCCICQLKGSRIYEPIQQIWPQLITDSMLFLLKAKMTWTIHKSGHLLHSFSDTGETDLLIKKLKRHFLFKAFFDKSFSQISCECLLSPKNFSQERLLPRQVIEGFTTSIHIYSSKIFREKEDMCTMYTYHMSWVIWKCQKNLLCSFSMNRL